MAFFEKDRCEADHIGPMCTCRGPVHGHVESLDGLAPGSLDGVKTHLFATTILKLSGPLVNRPGCLKWARPFQTVWTALKQASSFNLVPNIHTVSPQQLLFFQGSKGAAFIQG